MNDEQHVTLSRSLPPMRMPGSYQARLIKRRRFLWPDLRA
jgi:hypothetical protein